MTLVADALKAANRQIQRDARRTNRKLLQTIRYRLGFKYAKATVFERDPEFGAVGAVDGIRFRLARESGYGFVYHELYAEVCGSWSRVSDLPGLGQLIEERHQRAMLADAENMGATA